MEKITLNTQLVNTFFGGMDNECLEEIRLLVEQGAVIDPLNGELVLNNTRTGILTDYFQNAFYLDEDERPYQVGDQRLVIASRKNPYGGECQYICIERNPRGSDGWDYAQSWDPNSKECYGDYCRVYPVRIETADDEWESFPIWFESREDAIISIN